MANHNLLNHLDKPAKILSFPVTDVSAFIGCILVGVWTAHPLYGLLVASLFCWLFKKSRGKEGAVSFSQLMYWYLPTKGRKVGSKKGWRIALPSHNREYRG